MINNLPVNFIADDMGIDQLPTWVKPSKRTTDGHLHALAKSHGAVLATLNENLSGSFLIPKIQRK